MKLKDKVILVIRDGWGFREDSKDNAVASANTPINEFLVENYPNTLLQASGNAVGLPEGYQGNSEVGHITIGSGRINFQSLERINESIKSGDFFKIEEFNSVIDKAKENNSKLHLIGLMQKEGVHSHVDHLFALLELCKKKDFKNVLIHAITDGRDAPPTNGATYFKEFQEKIDEIGVGEIVTLSGRYFAMDRDNRWDRTEKAYKCIAEGDVEEFDSIQKVLSDSYEKEVTDEFINPVKRKGYEGIKDGDSVIFFNLRTDRTRQLTKSLIEDNFQGFSREKKDINFVAMTQYYSGMKGGVAFKDEPIKNILGEVLSKVGVKQLRISETEKYAHVSFFFNSQEEEPFEGEDRILIPSPKVATYDLKPEMSAYEVKEKLVEQINSEEFEFIVVNLVNCDLVGHTGIEEAIKEAVEAVDECTGDIVNAGMEHGYTSIVLADHGNAEDMGGMEETSHTTNPVPCILVSKREDLKGITLKRGGLQDVAPTVLKLMGIEKPEEMTGKSLV
jgi:2,3-bisphosphoglycerate-independent phosphoglycerate mutase